jgi:hypothetical protein
MGQGVLEGQANPDRLTALGIPVDIVYRQDQGSAWGCEDDPLPNSQRNGRCPMEGAGLA